MPRSVSVNEKIGALILKLFFPIPATIQNPPDFHDVSNYYIEDSEVPYLDAIVRVLTFSCRVEGLEGFRTGKPF